MVAAALLGVCLAACSQTGSTDTAQNDIEATVASLERARFAAIVAKDTVRLGQLLADDMTYAHSTGTVQTRAEFLTQIANGRLDYRVIEPTELRVRVFGEAAVVEGRVSMVVPADSFVLRFIDVWVRRGDSWRMAAWQSTRLPT